MAGFHGQGSRTDADPDPQVESGGADHEMIAHGPRQPGAEFIGGDTVGAVAETDGKT